MLVSYRSMSSVGRYDHSWLFFVCPFVLKEIHFKQQEYVIVKQFQNVHEFLMHSVYLAVNYAYLQQSLILNVCRKSIVLYKTFSPDLRCLTNSVFIQHDLRILERTYNQI